MQDTEEHVRHRRVAVSPVGGVKMIVAEVIFHLPDAAATVNERHVEAARVELVGVVGGIQNRFLTRE